MTKKALASRLRKRITIQLPIQQSDGGGGYEIIWRDYKTVFAEIVAIQDSYRSGEEIYQAMQFINNGRYQFTIRFDRNINTKMRIKYNHKYFGIKRIINVNELNYCLKLITEEEGANDE